MTSNESQKHGFIQEKDILKNVYGATDEKLSKKGYTDKFDLDADDNKLNPVNLSIKTTVKDNNVCMGDCLRFFDSVSNTDKPIHLTVIFNQQIDNKKKVKKIVVESSSESESEESEKPKRKSRTGRRNGISHDDEEGQFVPHQQEYQQEYHNSYNWS